MMPWLVVSHDGDSPISRSKISIRVIMITWHGLSHAADCDCGVRLSGDPKL